MALIYRGAEAEIRTSHYMGNTVVQKKRIPKSYRLQIIDSMLRSYRTKEEAKLMKESRLHGVPVPIIYDVDLENNVIIMEYLEGSRIKDILNNINEDERANICKKIGKYIARLHNNDLIHGDITTSNMILVNERIHFIDFGLGEKNSEIEAKGVDLHVLMEALASAHSQHPKCFDYVLEGYKQELNTNSAPIIKKIEEIVKRGRYMK